MDLLRNVECPTEAHRHDSEARVDERARIAIEQEGGRIHKAPQESADTDGRQAEEDGQPLIEAQSIEVVSNVLLGNECLAAPSEPHVTQRLQRSKRSPWRPTKQVVAPPAVNDKPKAACHLLPNAKAANHRPCHKVPSQQTCLVEAAQKISVHEIITF
jgi:hypothetical protein